MAVRFARVLAGLVVLSMLIAIPHAGAGEPKFHRSLLYWTTIKASDNWLTGRALRHGATETSGLNQSPDERAALLVFGSVALAVADHEIRQRGRVGRWGSRALRTFGAVLYGIRGVQHWRNGGHRG